MKKILVFLSILLFPLFSLAKEYELSDINIKLDIRDDFITFTKDNLENNSDLTKLGISKEYMEEVMDKNNIYFDIIKNDVSYEILVIVPDTKLAFNNLSNATDSMLNDLKGEIVKKTGAEISDVYKSSHNYILVDYYDSKTGYYIVNYYTVVNASGYNFQLQKKSAITEDEKKELKELVDSVEIKVLDEYKDESKDTQESIDNYNNPKRTFDFKNILYGAIIGAASGLLYYVITIIIKKKKSS